MKTTGTNKILIPLIGIFILGMFIYNFFLAAESSVPGDLSASNIGNDLLEIKSALELVTLDKEIFSDQKFLELSDFSAVIPDQPTGRTNPFDDIGQD